MSDEKKIDLDLELTKAGAAMLFWLFRNPDSGLKVKTLTDAKRITRIVEALMKECTKHDNETICAGTMTIRFKDLKYTREELVKNWRQVCLPVWRKGW